MKVVEYQSLTDAWNDYYKEINSDGQLTPEEHTTQMIAFLSGTLGGLNYLAAKMNHLQKERPNMSPGHVAALAIMQMTREAVGMAEDVQRHSGIKNGS